MIISEIRGFHLSCKLGERVGNALTTWDKREALLVQIVTDAGLSGWGEVGYASAAAGTFIRRKLVDLLLGRSPRDYGRHYQAMIGRLGHDRRGTAMLAVSALDVALHDLAARALDTSIAGMLGGALRSSIFAYASGPFMREGGDPYRCHESDTASCRERGFRGFKPRVGQDPRADGTIALALRRQIGVDCALMADMNQCYTPTAAIASAERMQDADLLWIEEPVAPDDNCGYQFVAAAVSPAVAGGEALASPAAFRDFLAIGKPGLVQPDLSICGGFSGFRRIAAIAQAHGVPVMPHVFGTAVNFNASLQMASILEAHRGGGPAPYPFIEYDISDNPFLTLLGPHQLDRDGSIAVPEGPGTGIELTPAHLERWITDSWAESVS